MLIAGILKFYKYFKLLFLLNFSIFGSIVNFMFFIARISLNFIEVWKERSEEKSLGPSTNYKKRIRFCFVLKIRSYFTTAKLQYFNTYSLIEFSETKEAYKVRFEAIFRKLKDRSSYFTVVVRLIRTCRQLNSLIKLRVMKI